VSRILTLVVALSIITVACQPLPAPETTSTSAAGTPDTLVDNELGHDWIAVSTVTGAIAVHSATGESISHLDPPDAHIYSQPTWLDGSTIVFSDVSETGDHALVAADAESARVVWRAEMETPPFYFSPAPVGSPFAATSLRNDPSGAGLIAELVDHSGAVTPLSTESPFYTSWSPGGMSLAIHIAGQHLDIRSTDGTETILSETGLFQTPVWVESGLVTLRTLTGTQFLTLWEDGSFTDIAEVEGPVGFVGSHDRVAVQATDRPDPGAIAAGLRTQVLPTIPGGNLVVIDLPTATLETVSTELALLYQWDQSGESLLYATLADEPVSLTWNIWSDGRSAEIVTFLLQPPWFRSLVPFFDQYAQSVQLWSSSGDHIGYPAVVDGGPVVVIESLNGISGAEPVIIQSAIWSAWAPSG
jgi:hypothetical protein